MKRTVVPVITGSLGSVVVTRRRYGRRRVQRWRKSAIAVGSALPDHLVGAAGIAVHDLDRQVARITAWATVNGYEVGEVVTEVGSGTNGKRPKIRRVLSDPSAKVVVVEHRDRQARFGVEHLEAALSAQGRRIVVTDDGETEDDLVRDMIEVLTSMCVRLYGRRGARNRAMRAVTATKQAGAEVA
ncbi:IS607 family transposase [Mycolicibacterium phocaicum]|uniref:IS607 family transposase n=1 Tax=Mycolicibacterium phocaicum TaxID=319706 RepID=UPI003899229D